MTSYFIRQLIALDLTLRLNDNYKYRVHIDKAYIDVYKDLNDLGYCIVSKLDLENYYVSITPEGYNYYYSIGGKFRCINETLLKELEEDATF